MSGIRYKPKTKTLNPLLFVLVFPIIVTYYELVFSLSTSNTFFSLGTLLAVVFSFVWGSIGYLLCTISANQLINRIIASSLILLTALPFLVEYFVYRQFKVFYDLQTTTGGAADAVGGFSHDIVTLVISWDGFFKIALFLLPFILSLIFGKQVLSPKRVKNRWRLIVAGCMVVLHLLNVGLIAVLPLYSAVYRSEYNFQSAVSSFGLLTALRLDLQRLIFNSDTEFETDAPITGTTTTTPPPPEEEPIVYTPNELPLSLEKKDGTIGELNEYVASLTPSLKNAYTGLFKGKNLIMISAEAFTAEVIDPVLTPTLYRLATKGINFTDHYQPATAGTTGGEYQNIFGLLPTAGGKSLKNTADHLNYFTIGSQLNREGYYGKAFHNNSYTYYSRHKTHINLGYSDGFMGWGNGMEKLITNQWPQSDNEMIMATLPSYIDKQPFNVYYMSVSGHSGYSRSGNAMTRKHWDRVENLSYSDPVKGYLAANLDLEDAMTNLVAALEEKGIADDTVICISADHFPYGLDSDAKLGDMPYLSELYGYSVTNYMQRDHSRLILWCGELEKSDPIIVDTPTSSLDLLPTLSNLFGTAFDSRLMPGRDVFSDAAPLVFNLNYDWKTEYGTYISFTGTFTPANETVVLPEGYVASIKKIVRNKIRYCSSVLNTDYFRSLFG